VFRAVLICFTAVVTVRAQPGPAQATVGQYCQFCHNDKLKTAGFSLDAARAADVSANAAVWEKVLHKFRSGEMPPAGLPRPDAAGRTAFINTVEAELDHAAVAHPNPGAPLIHRLNRAEYRNAIRDLLALDIDHSAGLPPDDSGYGFDNISDVLSISPLHIEKYMSAARRAARLAVGTVKASPALERFSTPRGNQSFDELPLAERSGLAVHRYFPLPAEYSILVRVRGNPAPNTPTPRLDVRVDGKRVKLFDAAVDSAEENQGTRNFEVRATLDPGVHVIGAAFLSEFAKTEGGQAFARRPPVAGAVAAAAANAPPQFTQLGVEYIAVGGPFNAKGPGDSESRRRIFICRPAGGEPEAPCAQKILSALAHRAYRRPVTTSDVDPLMKLFSAGRADGGSFDTGIEMALRAMLVSPDFLFRVEHSVGRVTDLELASRLSFFLWSSIPDDELLTTAEKGKLHDPAVLAGEVRRMLADPKSNALVENFAGQWLQLRNVKSWHPDPDRFPEFDDSLRTALERESELFFQYIVKEDRSVLDFIDADYTFLNDRLARHYGIAGVRGSYFRRVALATGERGGILTQGAVLMVSSRPTRTSPVLRGKWILENVLGAPPPPPPPDVPALSDAANNSAKDLRAQLEKHRANAACATCHVRLDPMGFALENYDATGKFRTQEGGSTIDASGQLPGGIKFSGPAELKKILLERKDEFVECMAEKLMTYALGRGLESYDQPAVRQVRRETAANDYKFSAMVLAIVNSTPFEMRRTPDK